MSCHDTKSCSCEGKPQVHLLGTANSGKSSLFNKLTGRSQVIGNWPGVTVDRKTGICETPGLDLALMDLPGVATLSSPEDDRIDERITRQALLNDRPAALAVVLDPIALERSLAILMQALAFDVPVIAVMTKADLWPQGVLQDAADRLSAALALPVVATSVHDAPSLAVLREELLVAINEPHAPSRLLTDPFDLIKPVQTLAEDIARLAPELSDSALPLAHRLMEGDKLAREMVPPSVLVKATQISDECAERLQDPTELVMATSYFNRAFSLAQLMELPEPHNVRSFSDKIDRFVLSKWAGPFVFLGIMYVMFFVAINVSSYFIDLFDGLGDALFIQTPLSLLYALGLESGAAEMVITAIGGGLQTVGTFAPIVGLLFLCQIFLEQSGYMARAAVVADGLMRRIGLPGRAFLPLILGFGCTVPAVIATRTLATERERVVTSMMAPFMSCGARLPVYALFAAAFFPVNGQNIVFALYLLGVGVAIFTGWALSRSFYKGQSASLAIELPTYQMPQLSQVMKLVWTRLKIFLFGAGKIIVTVVAVLTILNSVDFTGNFGNEANGRSVLAVVSKQVTPIFSPMGLSQDDWPATVGLVTGIFAKEAVVGTLQTLYVTTEDEGDAPAPLETAKAAIDTFTTSIVDLTSQMLDPLGVDIGDISTVEAAAEEQQVEVGLFTALASHFDGKVGAFAYMIAVLLYIPCTAALATIWREVGRNWALFAAGWTTLLAYSGASLSYQIGTFARHPASSAAWIVGLLAAIVGVLFYMRHKADSPIVPQATLEAAE
ncbi:Ferrous iron transport protein B [Pseudovibrio axinellae]|uniref:Ferrous iron transport protein B n=1 Tax=Pseudovibrio axinellae TaxID=989403 RepID=A0A165T5B0_9HYPH|nr:ferrous iron transport protein B [Pseudovibrio axinellae]KZL05453.1 Ferrous iron transport protein B [Pseudovibrio axinellae]SEP98576.1 ferrous iron transport protein B [Pseudovibrio axinellae]